MICRQIKSDVEKWLLARPFFSNVPVIGQDQGDVLTAVDEAIGKLGLVVVIETPVGTVRYADVGAGAISVDLTLTITENVVLNRASGGTGKQADDALDEILIALNPMNTASKELPCLCTKWRLVNDVGGLLIYQIDAVAQVSWIERTS